MFDLIAIDGNSLLFRAYYALPDMTARDGTPTGALHGFLMMLLRLAEEKPGHMVVAFDVHEPTFRHKAYDAYKAGRKPTPEDLLRQFPMLKEILLKMGITVCECPGFEADDILGTYARRAEAAGMKTLLVTGDRDALQLITEHTTVRLTKRGLTEIAEMTPATLMEQYGLVPDRMRDLKALMGDSSDNIPGVPGVGEKTAQKLLSEYGSLDGVVEHAEEIKGKLGERIRENVESARLSYWLGTINTEAPVPYTLEETAFHGENMAAARRMLTDLELRAVCDKLPEQGEQEDEPAGQEERTFTEISVTTIDEIRTAAENAKPVKTFAILGGTFSFDGTTVYRITTGQTLFDVPLAEEEIYGAFRGILEDSSVEKLCFDGKALLHLCQRYGISPFTIGFDAMLCDYLLDANRPCQDIASLGDRYFHTRDIHAGHLYLLRQRLEGELAHKGMTSLYHEMELPLMQVLFSMESNGVLVDVQRLQELQTSFEQKAASLSASIYDLAGEQFNILSPKQLGSILFEKLGLKPLKKTKSGYSTDSDTLERLMDDHPIVPQVVEYRFLTKLKSTFLDGLLAARSERDGRIHTQYQQCVTATGRLSSVEPNLQNIPVRTDVGREIRRAFIASEGNLLVGADYSQIELRILAHLSGDTGMIHAFRSGVDIHAATAAEVFGVSLENVTKAQRSAAKAVNFGIVYGISDFGLARNLDIPVKVAASYIETYLARYPRIKAYMEDSVAAARNAGYAETPYGRRRPLPEISSSNYNTRSFGERVAMNMPVQGMAADVIKLAMLSAHAMAKEKYPKAKLLLQVHDELIFEVPEAEAEALAGDVKACMEGVASLSVPLLAEVNIGKDWAQTK